MTTPGRGRTKSSSRRAHRVAVRKSAQWYDQIAELGGLFSRCNAGRRDPLDTPNLKPAAKKSAIHFRTYLRAAVGAHECLLARRSIRVERLTAIFQFWSGDIIFKKNENENHFSSHLTKRRTDDSRRYYRRLSVRDGVSCQCLVLLRRGPPVRDL